MAKRSEPDLQKVQALVDSGDFSAQEKSDAENKLARRDVPGAVPREQVVKIMMACARLGHGRLGAVQLQKLVEHVTHSVVATVKKSYWVCLTELLPQDDPNILAAVRPPAQFVIPTNFDISMYSIVDKKIAREKMPYDTGELELALQETYSSGNLAQSSGGGLLAIGGSSPAQAKAPASAPAPAAAETHRPSRVLQQEDSGERKVDLSSTLNGMALKLKEAAAAGRFYNPDPTNRDAVEAVLQRFVNFAISSGWTSGDEPIVAHQFVKFLAKRLRDTESLDFLPHVVPLMERLTNAFPSLLTMTGSVVMSLSKLDILTTSPLDYGALDLDQQNEFDDAKLYQQWKRRRFLAKLNKVRAGTTEDPHRRHNTLVEMRGEFDKYDSEGHLAADMKTAYEFGMTVLSPSVPLGGQVEYVHGLEGGWSLLATWWPTSPALVFQRFMPGADTAVDDVIAACAKEQWWENFEECKMQLNPVVVKLCETYKLKGLADCENTGDEIPGGDIISKAGGILWSLWRTKDVASAPPLTRKTLEVERARLEARKKEKEDKEKEEKERADKGKTDKREGDGGRKRAADAAEEGPDPKQQKGAEAVGSADGAPDAAHVFMKGAVVKCSCKLRRDRPLYDNMKGTVIQMVNSGKKVRVELLEGPQEGKTHDFAVSQLTIISAAAGAASSGASPAAAGSEAPPSQQDDLFSEGELDAP